ncbi:MAG: magnesium/cobalt transporter CorA [Gammaproteobacteria bacterium]|nr:magnesium/cobalt transporter CorA [Gammaproteobacteria bacterium]MDH5512977.1 magnesium/cobalt transporter CorA [Gammaproteobacteria bacterium]
MVRHVKKRSHKAGLPPGTPVHIGERKSETTRVTLMHFDVDRVTERDISTPEEIRALREGPGYNWFIITGLHEVEKLTAIGSAFDLHPLVLEDVLNTDQRPKFEDYGEYVFIVLQRLGNGATTPEIMTEQISLILGRNTVISFLESESEIFDGIKERFRANRGPQRKLGADFLVYALMDYVVDNYFAIFEKLGERIEMLQDSLIAKPTPESLQTLHALKREMLFLRKSVWPLREVVSAMQRGDSPLIQKETRMYLRDVYDHTIHVIDTIETYRDMLSGMLDIYLSSLSNKLNAVMKVLTIIATVFMPLTFIVGIYGMNFRFMPELGWRWGYPAVLLLLIVIAGGMLFIFRRKKWI